MKRILFVDDEPHVLQGLQRMLRPLRPEWETSVAAGGAQALDALAQGTFDAVVSDMRMPGMSGAELLAQVRALFPGTVRIILSGQSDGNATRHAAAVAHRFLSKPCDAALLKNAVSGACAARDSLPEALRAAVTGLASLPAAPALLQQWHAALADGDSTRAGQAAGQDAALGAKLLQLVNSAFFGTPRPVCDPAEAARLLGSDTLRGLPPELFAPADGLPCPVPLCDVGRTLLAHVSPERYAALRSVPDGEALCRAERAEFGADHAAVGASLLGLWGLPAGLCESVAAHHLEENACV